MYREALATAAKVRGWSVHWYDRDRVFRDAAAVLGREDVVAFLQPMGRSIGPPWQAKHKLAAAAALAAKGAAEQEEHQVKHNVPLTITSLLSILFMTFHVMDDISVILSAHDTGEPAMGPAPVVLTRHLIRPAPPGG